MQVIPDWPTLQHREKVQEAVPSFIRELQDQHLKEEDGQCVLEAEFSIPNPRKVRWFKNKLEIFLGNNIHIEHLDCIHKLTIKKLSPKDAGKYILQCDDIKTSGWIEVAGESRFYLLLWNGNETFISVYICYVIHISLFILFLYL